MLLSVLIPAHNEVDCIHDTVAALCTALDAERIPHEVLVVNDHSSDGTDRALAALAAEFPQVRWVTNLGPGGFGFAIRCGLENFRGDAVAIVMADASDDPADVVTYYRMLEQGYECVFGSRFTRRSQVVDYPPHKLFLNRLANWFIKVLFGLPLNDTTNAFKAYRREVIDGLQPLLACHFNLTVELPLKAITRGYSYAVVPINWYNRTTGFSKLKIKEMGGRYLFIVLYVYLEKLLENARHVEFQIMGDEHGNVIHLGERECSIQRRHQKLIEEAPSPALYDGLRERMGQMAVAAARSVNYTNAGTVEFLLDHEGHFYFLEMNTRLQVEHPVTEMVTGVDIVKEQLRIAAGRKLRYRQEDITLNGWALECRITAEDPYNNFLPSTGTIVAAKEPTGPGVRVESGIYEGFEVSLYYDPMVAKLVAWGETRAEAILRMRRALDEYRIIGVKTSIPFHRQVMDSTSFIGGQFDTGFIENRFHMIGADETKHGETAAIVATMLAHQRRQQAFAMIEVEAGGDWRISGRQRAVNRW